MSLRRKTILILTLMSLLYALAGIAVLRFLVFPEFVQLEQSAARDQLSRFQGELEQELGTLQRTAHDYGEWDQCYNFATGDYPDFPQYEMPAEIYGNLNINYVCVTDASGGVLHQACLPSLGTAEGARIDAAAAAAAQSLLPRRPADPGFTLTPLGLLAVVRSDVKHSDHSGPVAGQLYMGRLMSDQHWREIAERNRMRLQVVSLSQARQSPDILDRIRILKNRADGSLLVTSPNELTIWSLLPDCNGGTAAMLAISSDRGVSNAGRKSVLVAGGLSVLLGILFLFTVLLILEHNVLGRLARMSRAAQAIASDPKHGRRLPVSGGDEVAAFSDGINRMLESLEEAERAGAQKMREAEVRAIRMTAATYAHEINNPLAGLVGYLQILRDDENPGTERCQVYTEMLDATQRISEVIGKIEGLHSPRRRHLAGRARLLELGESPSQDGARQPDGKVSQ